MRHRLPLLLAALAPLACAGDDRPRAADPAAHDSIMNPLAEAYVKLVLAVGEHSADYVDAYYGPPEWRAAVRADSATLPAIAARADSVQAQVAAVDVTAAHELVLLRRRYLSGQLGALRSYVGMLQGARLTFDEESRALYDAVAPTYPESHFRSILEDLGTLLPGEGSVPARLEGYRRDFIIPRERVDTVFRAATAEARRRTVANVELPAHENFELEYVTGQPWSGYNWYQGDAHSLIQINIDLPIFIDRAIDLAAHEGYPGHHVYNTLLEHNLVRGRGWPEYSVFALFSPQALIAEGSANYGIEVAFPGTERLVFERTVLFPLAGIPAERAEEYARIRALTDRLSYAGNEAARMYLDGRISADSAAQWLTSYALMEPERARQRIRFFDTYRSYVINYNLGQDMVRVFIEGRGGTVANPRRRWDEFARLLSSPALPSDLRQR